MNIEIKKDENLEKIGVRVTRPTKIKGVSIVVERSGESVALLKDCVVGFRVAKGIIYAGEHKYGRGRRTVIKADESQFCDNEKVWVLSEGRVVQITRDGRVSSVRDHYARREFLAACQVFEKADGLLSVLKQRNAIVRVLKDSYGNPDTFLMFDDKLIRLGCAGGFDELVSLKIINKQGKIIGKKLSENFRDKYHRVVHRIISSLTEVTP